MTLAILLPCLSSQLCLAGGQLLIKQAMNATHFSPTPWPNVLSRFSLGILSLTSWFFLWLGLLQKKDLSFVFPFEGISPVLIVVGGSLFLKEKIVPRSWLGIGLISLGLVLVSAS
jgi:uncharacterized membrane protein